MNLKREFFSFGQRRIIILNNVRDANIQKKQIFTHTLVWWLWWRAVEKHYEKIRDNFFMARVMSTAAYAYVYRSNREFRDRPRPRTTI